MSYKTEYQLKLREYADDILINQSFHDKLAPAIIGLSQFLFELAGIQQTDEQMSHLPTSSGNAIGPLWAAQCSREIFRTQRFIKALYQAIMDKLDHSEGAVEVLYAGTGPFALLALPIMTQFKPDMVQFTLLEVNPVSFEKMKHCIAELGLNDFVKAAHCVDAVEWVLEDKGIDILISETMYNGLYREPQVSLMLNLASQVDTDCILIPTQIEVKLTREKSANELKEIASLICFNRTYIDHVIRNSSTQKWVLPSTMIKEPIDRSSKYYLNTYIQIYKDHVLSKNESSLNLPRRFYFPEGITDRTVSIQYQLGETPSFHVIQA